jgi:hypothetical protein
MHTPTLPHQDPRSCPIPCPGDRSWLHSSLAAARRIRAAGLSLEAVAALGLIWHAAGENLQSKWEGRTHLDALSIALGITRPALLEMMRGLELIHLVEVDDAGWVLALPFNTETLLPSQEH